MYVKNPVAATGFQKNLQLYKIKVKALQFCLTQSMQDLENLNKFRQKRAISEQILQYSNINFGSAQPTLLELESKEMD